MNTDKAADAKAAHEFLTELRTRVATQALPYQYGVEKHALESLWALFVHARNAMRDNPGCKDFADGVTKVLNKDVRPFTGKWDRAYEDKVLASRDGANLFRSDLKEVQKKLKSFAGTLRQMAYGPPEPGDDVGEANSGDDVPDVMPEAELRKLFQPVRSGFMISTQISEEDAKELREAAEQIAQDEAKTVNGRRSDQNPDSGAVENAVGLALSGGGIRSAAFSLGAVQELAERGLLRKVDFLSTVSGGGYTGSFLTSRLGNAENDDDVAAPDGPDTRPLCYLRQNARYLSGNNLKERWSMVCATLAGMLLNWSAPLVIIVVLAIVAHLGGAYFVTARPLLLLWLSGATLVIMGIYAFGLHWGKAVSNFTGGLLGWAFSLTLGVAATWLLDVFFHCFLGLDSPARLTTRWHGTIGGLTLGLGGLGTVIPVVMRFVPVFKDAKVRQAALMGTLWCAGLFVPCVAIALFYLLLGIPSGYWVWVLVAAVVLAFASFYVIDINLTAPHRLYRDGLARTFIWKHATDTDPVPLAKINQKNSAPYHILNATLNVPSSETVALKDRGCDFFMFTKDWTGSPATGYQPTENWKANGAQVDLASAMAISGAAISSYMGLGSMPTLTSLLTMLNLRLGFWIRHPNWTKGDPSPGFLCLIRETFGLGMTEKAHWLNLSDGGHIENMGIYELLRRRCKYIICVDGEADPGYTFGGLMTLVRHARIDFGVTITPTLTDLRPQAATTCSASHFHLCRIKYPKQKNAGNGNAGDKKTADTTVVGENAAGSGTKDETTGNEVEVEIGLLLYVKLSLTGDESELIRKYRTMHQDFPHQTTLDQFFDQEQFEAYRQLGVHVAQGLFNEAILGDPGDAGATAGVEDDRMTNWMRRLAKSLLEPEE